MNKSADSAHPQDTLTAPPVHHGDADSPPVVQLTALDKFFRKTSISRGYGTIKSIFVDTLAPGPKKGFQGDTNYFASIKNVNLAFKRGSTVGLIGRNGSGKSTLLKLIAGIYKPTSGRIDVNGRISPLIELGAGFHPDFSGRENIYINGIILGLTRKQIAQKFDRMVEFAELENFIDAPVRTYSSGMYMRLGFSVAVHADPDILLVDEVFAVGDESFAHKCLKKLAEFKHDGKTIILVTHDTGYVVDNCDEAVWLDTGEVRGQGNPRRVVDEYLDFIAKRENEAGVRNQTREADTAASQGKRWGSRTAEIKSVELLDTAGTEKFLFAQGDELVIRIGYFSVERIDNPVFGIAVFKADGTLCFGTNTDIEDVDIKQITGAGTITVRIPRLELVEGSYTLSVAVHAVDHTAYDYHDQMYPFQVRAKTKAGGVFRPQHTWTVLPGDNGGRKA